MYYVRGSANLQSEISKLLTDFFGDKAEVRGWSDGKLYVKVKEDAGFKGKEDRLSKEEIEQGVCGGGIVEGLDGKLFCIQVSQIENWPWLSRPVVTKCICPNAYYYGDTNPPTYKCPDCGMVFVKNA